ncbi:anthranilate phosphoribosyltransferase [Mechercharimyces sp. CAU 1602]|uniref:anthranilate phosphoribosyltransferase n=1 Tax=Mechercharimyces sp. CAU 1602 TaxID=2973933 RepID=UPI002163F266|nr:anthranilate phosphoribosyltransferase [Mechercharimyces sp. CAU 1602]MCS1350587.1 anthranilate phosphoribosyltransferase [Mechercharimyces sp. CAU 1602]
MIQQTLAKMVSGQDLTRAEATNLMEAMMEGVITPAQAGAALTALRMKGETVEELTGLVSAMRAKALPMFGVDRDAVDTCGTGGDGGRTFNVSTTAAIVAAAAGVKVAKHGNRAVSGKSGSADVLEALGVNIGLSEKEAVRALEATGICFLFAPLFHQSLKHVMPTRKELGFRTSFNLLGPLANPAGVKRQLVGVFDPTLTEPVARVLVALGAERVMVVAGMDGIDEISVSRETRVTEGINGEISSYMVTPEELGLTRSNLMELAGGDAHTNAQLVKQVLQGESGGKRDVILANAGAVIAVAGMAKNVQEGIAIAAETIDSGAAMAKLTEMVAGDFRGKEEGVSYVS